MFNAYRETSPDNEDDLKKEFKTDRMLYAAEKADQLMNRYQINLDQAITYFKHPNLWTLIADKAYYFTKPSFTKPFYLNNGSLNTPPLLSLPHQIYTKILSFISPGFTKNLDILSYSCHRVS